MSKCGATCHAQESGFGMTIHAHGGHAWVRMDAGVHNCGLGHGKQAKQAADGCCQSCVHARTAKRQSKTRFGEEWQGRLVEAQARTGDTL